MSPYMGNFSTFQNGSLLLVSFYAHLFIILWCELTDGVYLHLYLCYRYLEII